MGVVWGDGTADGRGRAGCVGISDRLVRLARAVWRRLVMYGGEA